MERDNINPDHYKKDDPTYETIKVIEAWGLGFRLGNVLKYISRAGKKGDRTEDLKKARWYLDREISMSETNVTADIAKDGDGWIEHTGDECPVDHQNVVDVRVKSGKEFFKTKPMDWSWRTAFTPGGIAHYRIHKP